MTEKTDDLFARYVDESFTLDNLGISEEQARQEVVSDAGAIEFGPSEMIAPWTGGIYWLFMSTEDHVLYNQDRPEEPCPQPSFRSGPLGDDNWFRYYYRDYTEASAAYDILVPAHGDRSVNRAFLFTAPTAMVVNRSDEGREALMKSFGDTISFDSEIKQYARGSGQYPAKRRHMWNLITLPALVAAVATAARVPNAGYKLDELLEGAPAPAATEDDLVDGKDPADEFFHRFCGDPQGEYENSILAKRRAELWKSLGEEDPRVNAVKGSLTAKGKVSRLAATSDIMSKIFVMVQGGLLQQPRWGRLVSVPDPAPYNPYPVPALVEIFFSEEHARAVATAEAEERGEEVAPNKYADGPSLPKDWASNPPDDWVGWLKDKVGEIGDPTQGAPPARQETMKKLIDACYAQENEILSWWAYIQEKGL